MARSHKYIKRTGSPGNYRYWYYDPSAPGGMREGNEEEQTAGKNDHARRLLAGRMHEHHAMSIDEMAREVGVTAKRMREHLTNMRSAGRRALGNPEAHHDEAGKHGHDFQEHHMKEAAHKHDVTHPDYQRQVQTHIDTHRLGSTAGGAPAPARRPRASTSRVTGATPTPGGADRTAAEREDDQRRGREARAARATPAAAPAPAAPAAAPADRAAARIAELRAKLRGKGVNLDAGSEEARTQAHEAAGATRSDARPAVEPQTSPAAERTRARNASRESDRISGYIQNKMHGHQIGIMDMNPLTARVRALMGEGMDLEGAGDKAFKEFKDAGKITESGVPVRTASESVSRARAAAASPSSPAARALGEVDPAFAASEEPIRRMVESQAAGGNPYLDRAKDIYNRISADLKPERKEVAKCMLGALEEARVAGDMSEASILTRYKRISGKNPRGLSGVAEEFEKATFMTLDEVMGNKPIDVEVERFKRGYAAKQFSRMKPFLKGSWLAANPSAPPPYPTFGDVKSWTEHTAAGNVKPGWAGTTRMAMPKEVFDATHQIDGKPQYPPAWMPIHLAPVWHYISKKAQAGGGNAYQTVNPMNAQGKVNAGNQAGYQEGIAINALRKYVQMRGGPDQLVDIPANKLSEMGLHHADIFKSEGEMDDRQLFKVMKTKIIDPVALLPFVKRELKGQTKKSFSLVVDADLGAFPFAKSFVVSDRDIAIAKIQKALLKKRQG